MNHSILCVQFMCFRDLFHNLSPGPLWSGTHYFILHTFLTIAARLSDNKGVQFSGKGVLPPNTEIITRPTSPILVTICQINLAKLIPSQFSCSLEPFENYERHCYRLILFLSPVKYKQFTEGNAHVALKGSPYSIIERRVLELIPVLGSQSAGEVSHKPGGRLPLLSARPTVTLATLKRAATNFAAWRTEAQWVKTVCLRLLPNSIATAV